MSISSAITGTLLGTCLAITVFGSCSNRDVHGDRQAAQQERNAVGADADRIGRLRVGMSYEEVMAILGEGPGALSVPALFFAAEGGGVYYAVFYDERSTEGGYSFVGLQYVVKFPATDNLTNGYYVFPPEKRGKKYKFPAEP